ncbi:MAG: TrkH family potassium uptake protein [Acidobacteriota bacterium]
MKEDKNQIFKEIRFNPAQVLAISFLVTILVGAILLSLPFSTTSERISFTDALFTSTSAVCVTGLIVQDTGTYFSSVGQVIIMLLFQIGGLGIMTFSTLVLLVAGKSIAIKDSITLKEDFFHAPTLRVHSLIKNILLYTLCLESLGTLFFYLNFNHKLSAGKALFHSIFHSISAFCNAGFCLYKDSFESYSGNIWINMNLIFLIVLGGLGFMVLKETASFFPCILKKRRVKFSLHTKLVFKATFFLLFFSFILFFILESNHSLQNVSFKEKIISSVFQVVTPRTAGFNTMDMNALGFGAVFLLIVLMFIGASPGSTGGGIKTSTVGAVLAFLKSRILARESVTLSNRTIPFKLITKAFTVVTLSISVICVSVFILLISQSGVSMEEVFFEVFSAFGTVGLSLGLTPRLNDLGKIVIILTMYIGRIGPLTFLYIFTRDIPRGRYDYVEESVMIG